MAKNSDFNVDLKFIAKHPSAILIFGGILMIILEKTGWAIFLIITGIILHIIWLLNCKKSSK
jgi:hypothetical protein